MDTSKLFDLSAEGYNCEQVEEYIGVLRNEYQKIFDYAKGLEVQLMDSDGKKDSYTAEVAALTAKEAELKKLGYDLENQAEVLRLREEALEKRTSEIEKKAAEVDRRAAHHKDSSKSADEAESSVSFKSPSGSEKNYETLFRSLSVMTLLSEEVVRENQELRAKIASLEG